MAEAFSLKDQLAQTREPNAKADRKQTMTDDAWIWVVAVLLVGFILFIQVYNVGGLLPSLGPVLCWPAGVWFLNRIFLAALYFR